MLENEVRWSNWCSNLQQVRGPGLVPGRWTHATGPVLFRTTHHTHNRIASLKKVKEVIQIVFNANQFFNYHFNRSMMNNVRDSITPIIALFLKTQPEIQIFAFQ